jgi:AraC-like DNA-binding protein
MKNLDLLTSAGLGISLFTCVALLAAPRRREGGRLFLALVCFQAALLFLKDVVEQAGGPARVTTFLIFANFLFGLPALYLFMRAALGQPVRRPLLRFLPALLNIPAALLVARAAIGSAGIDSAVATAPEVSVILPIIYINLLAAGETLQLVLYARESLSFLRSQPESAKGTICRRIVVWVVGCYAVYHAVRWTGLGIRLFAARGAVLAPLPPWVNAVSMVFVASFVGLVGLYVVTRPVLLFGRRAASEAGPKYGGTPLARAEAESIVRRATGLLAACADLSEENVDPRRLAERLGIPYYLLSRAVNEHHGQTVADLIREQRVERAKTLLDAGPDATILRVAIESGFRAKSSFNDAFRHVVGMSPSEYRKRAR